MADAIKEIEIEADGFITREQDLLERVDANRAKPVTDCLYPNCERCDKYHGHYCTVPMVVSKQIWRLTEALIVQMENRLTDLENLVTDEIIGSKERRIILQGSNPMTNAQGEELNYTWDDFLRKENK